MPCNKRHSKVNLTFILHGFLLCLLCTSCAQKRWTETLGEDENLAMEQLIATMQEKEQLCPQSLDADMKVFWKNPVASRAVEGYAQLLAPSFMKFIVSNPLGQPVFVFSGDGKRFQILQPTKQTHMRGGIRSLAIRYKMPLIITQENWFAYMTSRLPVRELAILETNQGKNSNTVWLRFTDTSRQKKDGWTYLHLDRQKEEVLGYLFLDKEGETLAEISYPGKNEGSIDCPVQTEITVSELQWDAEINIKLGDISSATQLNKDDFPLPVPAGFSTQIWP